MTSYCKTIGEYKGHIMYGIDLVEYTGGKYAVLMSKPELTDNWQFIWEIVQYANIVELPPKLFDEFLE